MRGDVKREFLEVEEREGEGGGRVRGSIFDVERRVEVGGRWLRATLQEDV